MVGFVVAPLTKTSGPNSPQDTSGSGAAAVFGDFVSTMFDFDTRNRDFQQIFTEIHKVFYIEKEEFNSF